MGLATARIHWHAGSMRNSTRRAPLLAAMAALLAMGCEEGKAEESFSAFERCVIGEAPKDDAELAQRMRALELALRKAPSETTAKDWPKRCEVHANALYQSLGSGAESTMLRKELATQLGCKDEPGSCKFPDQGTVLAGPAAIWQAAKVMGLERKPTPGVEPPKFEARSFVDAKSWPTLAGKGWALVDRHSTTDGKLWLLFRAPEGRVPVRVCELAGGSDAKASFSEAKCREPHSDVPKLPLQSVMFVDDDPAIAVAGLSEDGRKGYVVDTGVELAVRGYPGSEVSQGLAVERGANDEGYEAYSVSKGKVGKPIKIDVASPVAGPKTVGDSVAWVEKEEGKGDVLVIAASAGGAKLKEVSRLPGSWGNSELLSCQTPTGWIVASWGLAKGKRGANPTEGSDGSRISAAFYDAAKKAWSGPVTGKLPFQRSTESLPSCSESGLSIAWANDTQGQPAAGRVTCTAAGCKVSESSWATVGVQAWAGVAPLADDKLLAIYRTPLGDLRAKLGDASALAKGSELSLLDDESHGGPVVGEPMVLASGGAALLLFKREDGTTALRIGADGVAAPLPVK